MNQMVIWMSLVSICVLSPELFGQVDCPTGGGTNVVSTTVSAPAPPAPAPSPPPRPSLNVAQQAFQFPTVANAYSPSFMAQLTAYWQKQYLISQYWMQQQRRAASASVGTSNSTRNLPQDNPARARRREERAQQLLGYAQRLESAGRQSSATRQYRRIVRIAPDTSAGASAETALGRLTEKTR